MSEEYEKFDYALQLAWQFPCVDSDDDGLLREEPHYTYRTFAAFADKKIKELGISETSFYKNNFIIPVLEAYGLDKEKFFYAVCYVGMLTKAWSELHELSDALPSALEQLTKIRDEIKEQHEFRIVIDNQTESHSLVVAGNRLIKTLLVGALDDLIKKERQSPSANIRELPSWRHGSSSKSTEQTWYAARLFTLLLEALKLPVRRSRSIRKEYRTIEGSEVLIKGRDAQVSFDRNQLIAELIHFLNLTDNENLNGNSIKSILKEKRNLSGIGFF